MNLMSRLSADAREADRLRQARAEIARVERRIEKNLVEADPQSRYASRVLFCCAALLVLAIVAMDVSGEFAPSVVLALCRASVTMLGGLV